MNADDVWYRVKIHCIATELHIIRSGFSMFLSLDYHHDVRAQKEKKICDYSDYNKQNERGNETLSSSTPIEMINKTVHFHLSVNWQIDCLVAISISNILIRFIQYCPAIKVKKKKKPTLKLHSLGNVKFMTIAYEIGERIRCNLLHGHNDKWIGVDYQ